jgi:putative colanic acid biosynthesis acetyltransferase WcaF
MTAIDLSKYDNSWYRPGRSNLWRSAWFFLGMPIVRAQWLPSSSIRVALLKAFGARIGINVVIRPGVQVKYPWNLVVGDNCWIGERCWIDNLTTVRLGNNVCVSQAAYLCTGNHDWTDPAFGLMISPIQLNNASWVGAMAILAPGTVLGIGSVAAAGSVISGVIPDYEVHAGNPAVFVKVRKIRETKHSHSQEVAGGSR